MTNALQRQPNDVGLHSVPPTRPSDPRVRLAEEDALQTDITAVLVANSRASEWLTPINLLINSSRVMTIAGTFKSRIYPTSQLPINTTIALPALPDSSSIVRREDRLYLVVFVATVGQDHDPALGQISFKYRDNTNQILPTQKENALRDRAYWVIVQSSAELTPASFNLALPLEPISLLQLPRLNGDRFLPLSTIAAEGFQLGNLRVFARDPLLAVGNYPVHSTLVEVSEIAKVLRQQNYGDRGYTWGQGGEEPLQAQYNLIPIATPIDSDLDNQITQRLTNIFSGTPGRGHAYTRTVQNLTAGQVGGNPGRAGESSASPNGSVCLANSDRVVFSNQASQQDSGVQIVTAANDGSGNAVLSAQLANNAPIGSYFSEKATSHKIYRADGSEQSELGQFINLGGTGSLIWVASQNSAIRPGQQCYFVPAINYPAGSGFSIPFNAVEQIWVNGSPTAAIARIGEAGLINQYLEPTGGEFFAFFGKERAALHYILKKVTVTTDVNGVAVIPAAERGCFAFIQGVSGRIDAPVRSGLTPNTTYAALVYYPPRTNESWQVQLSYIGYQGTGQSEPTFLEGATVISEPFCFYNSQGGGSSVFRSDAKIQFSPVSMHLPKSGAGVQAYELDTSIRLQNESSVGALRFRKLDPIPGSGLGLPSPGMKLKFTAGIVPSNGYSLSGKLENQDQLIGLRTSLLYRKKPYQVIMAFLVEKAGQRRLVIATRVTEGGENVALDSSTNTAFDTFRI